MLPYCRLKSFFIGSLFVGFFFLLGACQSVHFYQEETNIPDMQWSSTFVPKFTFEVEDTTAYYMVLLYFRHTNAYPYSNVWVKAYSADAQDSLSVQKEFVLASTNHWMGNAITGTMIEHFMPMFPTPIRFHAKKYTIHMEQLMRDDPLKEVLSVGLRINKIDVANPHE